MAKCKQPLVLEEIGKSFKKVLVLDLNDKFRTTINGVILANFIHYHNPKVKIERNEDMRDIYSDIYCRSGECIIELETLLDDDLNRLVIVIVQNSRIFNKHKYALNSVSNRKNLAILGYTEISKTRFVNVVHDVKELTAFGGLDFLDVINISAVLNYTHLDNVCLLYKYINRDVHVGDKITSDDFYPDNEFFFSLVSQIVVNSRRNSVIKADDNKSGKIMYLGKTYMDYLKYFEIVFKTEISQLDYLDSAESVLLKMYDAMNWRLDKEYVIGLWLEVLILLKYQKYFTVEVGGITMFDNIVYRLLVRYKKNSAIRQCLERALSKTTSYICGNPHSEYTKDYLTIYVMSDSVKDYVDLLNQLHGEIENLNDLSDMYSEMFKEGRLQMINF